MKSDEDLEIGLRRAKAVLYSMYRIGALSKEVFSVHKDYDLKRDFLPSHGFRGISRDYILFTTLREALTFVYDYRFQRQCLSAKEEKNEATQKFYRDCSQGN